MEALSKILSIERLAIKPHALATLQFFTPCQERCMGGWSYGFAYSTSFLSPPHLLSGNLSQNESILAPVPATSFTVYASQPGSLRAKTSYWHHPYQVVWGTGHMHWQWTGKEFPPHRPPRSCGAALQRWHQLSSLPSPALLLPLSFSCYRLLGSQQGTS